MTRKLALGVIKSAGYHNDQRQFVRTYVENRISYPVAIAQFRAGASARIAGIKCDCFECKVQS